MKKLLVTLTLITGTVFFFASCTKTGPQGPQGPQGLQGNANVIGSDPFSVSHWDQALADSAWVASFDAPTITSAVADRGIVQVFLKYNDGTWRNLPDIINETMFYFRFSTGGFDIYYTTTYGRMPYINPGGPWTFRLVVVAPTQKAAHPNTNWNNYNEIMKVLEDENVVAHQATTVNLAPGQ